MPQLLIVSNPHQSVPLREQADSSSVHGNCLEKVLTMRAVPLILSIFAVGADMS